MITYKYIFLTFSILILVKETHVSGTKFVSIVNIYFVSECQIIPPLTIIVSEGLTEMYVCLV
jgi:hypothetical protein